MELLSDALRIARAASIIKSKRKAEKAAEVVQRRVVGRPLEQADTRLGRVTSCLNFRQEEMTAKILKKRFGDQLPVIRE